jgi:hypothetical protein
MCFDELEQLREIHVSSSSNKTTCRTMLHGYFMQNHAGPKNIWKKNMCQKELDGGRGGI